jgi:hypothetical protein
MKVKQYKATAGDRVEIVSFYPFQAESIGAKLTADGIELKDAKVLVEKWNAAKGPFTFEVVKG